MATTPSLSQHAPSPAPSHQGGLDEGFQQLQEFNKSVSVEPKQDAPQYPDLPDYYPSQHLDQSRMVSDAQR
jgi:hypothetical protein